MSRYEHDHRVETVTAAFYMVGLNGVGAAYDNNADSWFGDDRYDVEAVAPHRWYVRPSRSRRSPKEHAQPTDTGPFASADEAIDWVLGGKR
ncbi:MAG TPA: hypothetical protein VK453_25510 [Micromonosporaceae bacterium]|nr:hypothetical protein [Micromonosporaceae bacterium]